jgi:hypothetical protein
MTGGCHTFGFSRGLLRILASLVEIFEPVAHAGLNSDSSARQQCYGKSAAASVPFSAFGGAHMDRECTRDNAGGRIRPQRPCRASTPIPLIGSPPTC